MRPTRKAAILFGISVPLSLLIVTLWQDFWYVSLYFPCAVLALVMADFMLMLPSRRLQFDIQLPDRLYIGQQGEAVLQIEAPGYATSVPIQALLELSGETAPPSVVRTILPGRGKSELRLQVSPKRRGEISVNAFWLRWPGPMSLAENCRRYAVDKKIDVIPNIKGIYDAALQFFSRNAVYGVKTQRMKGEGTEFENLCEFAAGMDNRLIDWKRSARHHRLLAKEFRQERNHQIVLGFDTGHLMMEQIDGAPKLDHAIKAGLLLAWVSLYSGDLIGGCGFDVRFRSFLKPGRGMPYFTHFQRFSAGLDYHPEETNFTLGLSELNSRLQRRALVVIFTEFVDQISAELLIESLKLMTQKHVVIFATLRDPILARLQDAAPEVFPIVAESVLADDMLRERRIVLERIARLGVHCLDVSTWNISTALLNRYLMIKQRGLL